MKYLLIIASFFVLTGTLNAQVYPAGELTPDSTTYSNVFVKKLHSDERTTVFAIWVKDEVKPHKHEKHTEVVFVLEGKGKMKVGEEKYKLRKGDTVIIPQGSVHSVKTKSRKPLKVISVQAPVFTGADRIWVK